MFLTKIAEKTGLLNILAPRNTNKTEEPGDAALAQKLWKEEKILFKRLETQKEKEEEAATRGAFIKQQRVKYHHKASDAYYDAVIIGVHFDDGPDRPYYVSIMSNLKERTVFCSKYFYKRSLCVCCYFNLPDNQI
jgi:hypothetical protein